MHIIKLFDHKRLINKKVLENLAELDRLPSDPALRPNFMLNERHNMGLLSNALGQTFKPFPEHRTLADALNMRFSELYAAGSIVVDGEVVEPLIFLDFKNGVYTTEGVPSALGTVLVEDTDFGDWNPARVVGGTGLVGNNDVAPVLAGDTLDLITAGSTIVAYFTGTDGAFRFELVDSSDYNTYYSYKGEFGDGLFGRIDDAIDNVTMDELANGYHKIALTMIEGKIALSTDGAVVVAIDPAAAWSPPVAIMNMIVAPGITLETIGLYPPQDDADLPGLSALT
jgi:hypothetical protein